MESLLRLLLKIPLKRNNSKSASAISGFTMIELLVGTIIAALIITPLLAFVVDILNTDVREQAKTNTEQEVQAAAEYISKDLSQAVYMYDPEDDGFETFKAQLPYDDDDDRTLKLVFWKRQIVSEAICPGFIADPVNGCVDEDKDDVYVYSLVAYYLIEDDKQIWCQPPGSTCKRIARFQIKDGVRDPRNYTQYIAETDSKIGRSDGFNKEFNFDKPLEWTPQTEETFEPNDTQVLVNYIEDFPEVEIENNISARVEIKGNALRRLQANANCTEKSPYCPTAKIRIKGGGSIGQDN